MSLSREKKQELREMSRMEALRVVREVLATYQARKASGRITVDVRSGKAIWVKPVIADVEAPSSFPDETEVLRDFDRALREFQVRSISGTLTLVAYQGRGIDVKKVIELEKMRIG